MNKITYLIKNKGYQLLKKLYSPILEKLDNPIGGGGLELLLRKEFVKEQYILSKHKTISEIIEKTKIFIRLGDGELPIFHQRNSGFHSYTNNLSTKLLNAYHFALSNEDFIMGVNPDLLYPYTNINDPILISSCKNYKIFDFLSFFPLKNYADALVLRSSPLTLYQEAYQTKDFNKLRQLALNPHFYKNSEIGKEIFSYYKNVLIEKIKFLWKDKNIIVCEGIFSCFGVYNDLFENAKTVTRIHAKNYNAFSDYDNILKLTLQEVKQYPQDDIFIICALGHTSKILLVDLYKMGYTKGIDAGNLSIAYDSFLYGFSQTLIDDPIQMFCYPPIHYGIKLEKWSENK